LLRAKSEADKQRLRELFAFARDSEHCRHETLLRLLNYEGEQSRNETGCCDVCEGTARSVLREEAPLVDFFKRNKLSYNIDEGSGAAAAAYANAYDAAADKSHRTIAKYTSKEIRCVMHYLLKTGSLREARLWPWRGKISTRRTKTKNPFIKFVSFAGAKKRQGSF
jgi:superfamily II DNA helicase RecQ